jgi:hypothetical protein
MCGDVVELQPLDPKTLATRLSKQGMQMLYLPNLILAHRV